MLVFGHQGRSQLGWGRFNDGIIYVDEGEERHQHPFPIIGQQETEAKDAKQRKAEAEDDALAELVR